MCIVCKNGESTEEPTNPKKDYKNKMISENVKKRKLPIEFSELKK
uniref:Uncharacterized protein n=1 Tax=Anguilla anguilla TaxID=7936 RepID=A0A0E9WBY1_ANGAN